MGAPVIRKNDVVVVRQGKDKGKTGKVLHVDREKRRAVVERINFVKQFMRADRSKNIQGGIMDKEASVPLSRLMLWCGECGQGVRVRVKRLDDGTKSRICPKCETTIEPQK
jgi:large subunit ribosomal protein L24